MVRDSSSGKNAISLALEEMERQELRVDICWCTLYRTLTVGANANNIGSSLSCSPAALAIVYGRTFEPPGTTYYT